MFISSIYVQNELVENENFECKKEQISPLIEAAFYASHAQTIDPIEKAISECHQNFFPRKSGSTELIKEYLDGL